MDKAIEKLLSRSDDLDALLISIYEVVKRIEDHSDTLDEDPALTHSFLMVLKEAVWASSEKSTRLNEALVEYNRFAQPKGEV